MRLLIYIACGLILSPFLVYFLSYVQAQAWIDVFFKNVKKEKNGKKEKEKEE